MTKSRPFRRTILQSAERTFRDARVFITVCLLISERNAAFCEVVWAHVHTDPISRKNLDVELPHLPGNVRRNDVTVLQLYPKHCVSECFGDGPILCYRRLLGHECLLFRFVYVVLLL